MSLRCMYDSGWDIIKIYYTSRYFVCQCFRPIRLLLVASLPQTSENVPMRQSRARYKLHCVLSHSRLLCEHHTFAYSFYLNSPSCPFAIMHTAKDDKTWRSLFRREISKNFRVSWVFLLTFDLRTLEFPMLRFKHSKILEKLLLFQHQRKMAWVTDYSPAIFS